MAIVVIGGNARKVGKTSVAAALIAALPCFHWTAAKISELHAGECSTGKPDCGCSADEHAWAVSEETARSGSSDTSRFLAAGAERALWVRAKPGHLADAIPELRRHLAAARNVMLESNRVLEFLQPDVYLMVLDFAKADLKSTARQFLERANAFVLVSTANPTKPGWNESIAAAIQNKPAFSVSPPSYASPELITWLAAAAVRN